jgi:hypothetical protein
VRRALSRPVRAGLPAPLLLAVSFAVGAVTSIALAAVGAAPHVVALALLCGVCVVVGAAGRSAACLVVGPVFWLFLDGFVEHRWGVLGWSGSVDAVRLGCLIASGVAGGVLAAGVPRASEAVRGLWSARSRFRRASLEPFSPDLPSERHPWFWN